MDEKRLREMAGLNEAGPGPDPAIGKAMANDLVDVFKLSKGNKNKIREATFVVLGKLDAREKSAAFAFVANLADELDPNTPEE